MKTAIITGATGFIGSTFVNFLLNKKYKVLALGRCKFDEIKLKRLEKNDNLIYLQIPMESIKTLKKEIRKYPFIESEGSIFYHFAWGGRSQLSDLDVEAQLANVFWTKEAFETAIEIKCKKFIFVGTMEEYFAKSYLNLDHRKDNFFNRHLIYSFAKTAARNILKLSYKPSETDLIFATNSHVMGIKDIRDSFLQVTLKKLLNNEKLTLSKADLFFDVISSSDCSRAYELIGKKGKSGQEYWIGSGKPRLLKTYVEIMYKMFPTNYPLKFGEFDFEDIGLEEKQFSIDELKKDTGFKPIDEFEDIVKELYIYFSSLKKN